MTFHVAGDMSAGRLNSLAFDVVNPTGQQPSPDISVSVIFNDCGYVGACHFEDPDTMGFSEECYKAAGTYFSAGKTDSDDSDTTDPMIMRKRLTICLCSFLTDACNAADFLFSICVQVWLSRRAAKMSRPQT